MWRPKTLFEVIKAGEEITLKQAKDGRYICPNCRVHRHPGVFVDVRHLPITEDWACDACWTLWMRQQRVIDGGLPLSTFDFMGDHPNVLLLKQLAKEMEWKRRWVISHNAPLEIIAKFINKEL